MPHCEKLLDTIPKHIHMIAICGTAMGAFAGMLVQSGYRVTGSDEGIYPPMSDYLANLGISVMSGFRPENLNVNPDLVIVGNTVKAINPEAQELIRRGLPYMHLPQAIREFFLLEKHSVVVAGTHGKTTTTSLAAWVFESAGLDPGFLVGGVTKNFNANAKIGKGSHFIIEGDEYDSAYFDKVPKCWHYCPKTAALTSVEFDHGDIYRDIEHIKEAFSKFVSLIPEDGYLAVCADYPHALDVIQNACCRIDTYGFDENADVRITDLELTEAGSSFRLMRSGECIGTFRSPLWGRHNAANAAAVALMSFHHGIGVDSIQRGFDTFQGIRRRQEIIYDTSDIVIIDDFAHHPTKVRETVQAVRNRYPDRRLISVFEPRTNTSRRKFFQDLYPLSFDGSDMVVIAGIYRPDQLESNNAMDPGQLTRDINSRSIRAEYLPEVDEIISFLSSEVRSGDVILIMSNGGFGGIYTRLPEVLDREILTRSA